MQLNEFLNMGGYGVYVWPCYCITLFVFAINIYTTLREKRLVQKTISDYLMRSHES